MSHPIRAQIISSSAFATKVQTNAGEVTVKTASGTVTVNGKRMRTVEALLEDLDQLS
ncbi:MAG: hypothetical protein AAF222_13625 [Pseudomonadota bacterium]